MKNGEKISNCEKIIPKLPLHPALQHLKQQNIGSTLTSRMSNFNAFTSQIEKRKFNNAFQ